ncbi:MAG: type II toxin-antitoxin system VapC family toxin [Parvibaculaceae bacterium]
MILADTNVLIGAFRADANSHHSCRKWLHAIINRGETLALSSTILAAVVRITTNRRAFDPPSSLQDAIGYCDDLLSLPEAIPLSPGPAHWQIFSHLCQSSLATGNLVTDAWIAALAIESNCELVTLDRDFAKFNGLKFSGPDA